MHWVNILCVTYWMENRFITLMLPLSLNDSKYPSLMLLKGVLLTRGSRTLHACYNSTNQVQVLAVLLFTFHSVLQLQELRKI